MLSGRTTHRTHANVAIKPTQYSRVANTAGWKGVAPLQAFLELRGYSFLHATLLITVARNYPERDQGLRGGTRKHSFYADQSL